MGPLVTLYTRAGCCLCDDAKAVILSSRKSIFFDYEEVDIDRDPAMRERYNDEVPVVAINGVKAFKYRVDGQEFLRKVAART